jgi:acylphosphatase
MAARSSAAAEQLLRYTVFGKVQGVFFRKHTQAEGQRLGLRGWVMNTNAGTVSGEVAGPKAALEQFADWLEHTGSPKSKISGAEFTWAEVAPAEFADSGFSIKKEPKKR